MTQLSPTALEAAAKAMHSTEPWSSFWSTDDARLLATAAITAYLAQAEKEGWVMVPVEPTRGMVCAYIQSVKSSAKGNPNRGRDGKDEWMAAHTEKCRNRWRSMLAAAQNGGE